MTGSIEGSLGDAHFRGRYYQVSKEAHEDMYISAWDGWRPYWQEWTGTADWQGFTRIHTGQIIANLQAAGSDKRLRCRFQMLHPTSGLAGGADGECQSSDNMTTRAAMRAH